MKFDEKMKKIVLIAAAIIVVIAAIWFGLKVFNGNKGIQQRPGGQMGNPPSQQQGNISGREQGDEAAPTGEQTPQSEDSQEMPVE